MARTRERENLYEGPCTSSLRVITRGLPGDRHKIKEA